ncbi:MAG: hypothetical protein HY761_08660 [Candidatus Omnitrophica bacterium]|nr:hypothetical protein [Candidatus Omnitrophota bacterium]
MMQRWLAAVLLHAENRFNRIKGFALIPAIVEQIEAENSNMSLKEAA